MSERDPQGRDPFENLKDLIDQPVEPRDAFTAELRARLMREMSASEYSREEQAAPMDAVFAPRPPVAFPTESVRRIRPMIILELAAVAVIVFGLAAALNRGWFGGDPEPPTIVPAAALQGDATPMSEEPTATALPETMEPTVVPPGNFPGTVWALPGTEGEQVDFGGMLVDDGVIYRLLATPTFVGVQAVDGATGAIVWQQVHRWAGHLFAIEDDTLYFDGGGNVLTAVDAKTGAQRWRANVPGGPLAIAEADDRIFVLLGNDMISALDEKTGDQLWIAQGPEPQNLSGGSASDSSAQLIAVDGNTVAYIASYGVFSGHDAQTGELLWSHEGYEAATSSIQTENDRFIVIDAAGLWVDGQEVAPIGTASVVSLSVGNTRIDNCSELFSSSATGLATALPPTPEGEIVADGFRIQAIDPVTGDVLWEQQTAPGVGSAWNQAPGRGVTSSICAVEVGDGTAIALTGHDDAASDGTVVIGSVSDGVFYSGIVDDDMQAIGAVIGSAAMLSDTVVYGIARDGAVFLQLVDGTLIRVDVD